MFILNALDGKIFLYRYKKHRYMLELIDIRVCIAQVRIRIVLWFLMDSLSSEAIGISNKV